ncbi:MAG: protein kinase [Anaerolineae bacterium]|nr:protein kinase [Anaerolineae bacterium]MDW8170886.1 protein kinase [Anaerolineae bacterium]
MDNQVGRVIKSYELEGLIGMGGFGAVYRARQAVVEREVAIKIIWPAFANHPNFIRRFEAEAQLVAGLEHPYIVPLYDYWRDPEGAYIVMRWLRGGHLRSQIDNGPLPLNQVSRVLENVAAALALAHRYGVVHRDIKPENILLDDDGNAYLADFGIAQILKQGGDEFAGMGSPAYASPEQLAGGLISSQGDIYSLGIVLYEMLTGSHPFPNLEELSVTQLLQQRQVTPLPLLRSLRPDLPVGLDEVLQKATAFDARMRYPDALSLTHAFQQASRQSLPIDIKTTLSTEASAILLNPYKGLRAFQEADAANFFGREALVQRLLRRLNEQGPFSRFMVVVGPSGSGKSSVVRAGLIPALRAGGLPGSDRWFYDLIVPGGQPFDELENVLTGLASQPPKNLKERLRAHEDGFADLLDELLPPDSSELFLFIDQFEEVFTQVEDEQVINRFMASLHRAVVRANSRLRLVVAIRADFYDRPLLQPIISDMVRDRSEVVVPLSSSELERAIVEPTQRVGVTYDPGLVTAIINEVKEQPGALPLLQYALSELFELREGSVISPLAYKEMGGVRGALARRADAIYQEQAAPQREAMRQLFLRLITLGEGTEDTRRRALLSEVTAIRDADETTDDVAIMRQVIDTLGKARLLTFDRDPLTRSPTVEVAHEAIIREWSRLRAWLDDSRNDVRFQRALSSMAQEWHNAKRDPSYLLRGVRLEQYERWAQETTLLLTESEREFLDFSIAERLRREQEKRRQREREEQLKRQSITRLRLLVAFVTVAFFGALALSAFAFNERARAEQSAIEANRNAAFSQSIAYEASARNALADDDGDLALALALLSASGAEPPPQSLTTLANVAQARGTRMVLRGHSAWVTSVDINRQQTLIASASTDATVRLWDAASGAERAVLRGHNGDIEAVVFSPAGDLVASAAADFLVIVWDVAQSQERVRLTGHSAPVRSLAFSADGRTLYSGASDNLIIAWDVETGQERARYAAHQAAATVLAISPDGQTLLSGARDGRLLLLNAADGQIVRDFVGHRSAITGADFSADGASAISASADGTMILWDVANGVEVRRLLGNTSEVRGVAFHPDGRTLISATVDGLLRLWSAENGLELARLKGHSDALLSLKISTDGYLAVTGAKDNSIRVWNVGNPGEVRRYLGHQNRLTELIFSREGERFFSASADRTLRIWDTASGREAQRFTYEVPITASALDSSERTLLIGSRRGLLFQVNAQTGEEIARLSSHTANVQAVAYLPDGQRAISADSDGVIVLWNLATTLEERRYQEGGRGITDLVVSTDGLHFASASDDGLITVYRVTDGREVTRLRGHSAAVYSLALSPNGAVLASVGRDGVVILWDWLAGRERARLLGVDIDILWSVAYSPDGSRLLVGSSSGLLTLWDVQTLRVAQQFRLSNGPVFALAFHPRANLALSGDVADITAWRTFSDDLIDWARSNRYVRDFTCLERTQYSIEPLCPAS